MKTLSLLLLAAVLYAAPAVAQSTAAESPAVRQKNLNLDHGLAIQGYDPVAYFTQHKAVKGASANTFAYRGATYRFASVANLNSFRESPDKYEPQYGGWCAYALGATGEKVEIDPETFKIVDGKLFLFYNKFFNNTLPKWNQDEPNLHRKADASWAKFVQH